MARTRTISHLKMSLTLILKIKARDYLLEGANPRHEHDWMVWQDVKLPEGKILMHGVVSHARGFVEHPKLVAERIAHRQYRTGHMEGFTQSHAPIACREVLVQSHCARRVHTVSI